ncbi:ABC transporter permease [Sporolactobacillus nakayamae]|uniref:Sulfonate transport system permease protein n=1 Tax=Sporolactobacillus nakayamae TaxID=269670 RepID=A0A1I2QZ54_9BACL|nr:ABC transporter permease [Sporolactobacillus nakayamae]SFG31587.1 sulfonate transport system permease protein [Sporolactobacillus nakayamae]
MIDELTQSPIQAVVNKPMPSGKRASRKNHSKYVQALSLIVFFLLWQFFSAMNAYFIWFNPQFFPSPMIVLHTTWGYLLDGMLIQAIGASVTRVLAGFALGSLFGVLLGIVMSQSRLSNDLISPVLNMLGPIPVFAFLPIFMIWFGISELSKVMLIAYATFLPVSTYTMDGIKNVNPTWIRSAMTLGATRYQIFTRVILRAALPNVFVGMRISLALAFGALIVAEMMGSSEGLGFIIVNARNWFKLDDMFMSCMLIGLLYTLFNYMLLFLESVLFRWRKDGIQSAVER